MKEKILRATAKIISSEGLESTSTRAICDEVGISAPTLYYYYKSKTELFEAVTQFAFDLHRATKKKVRSEDALTNLRRYWDEYIRFTISEPELHRTMIVSLSQGNSVKAGFACFDDLVAEFKALEKTGMLRYPALQCAQMYLGAAQGISMIPMSASRVRTMPKLSKSTRDLVLDGLVQH